MNSLTLNLSNIWGEKNHNKTTLLLFFQHIIRESRFNHHCPVRLLADRCAPDQKQSSSPGSAPTDKWCYQHTLYGSVSFQHAGNQHLSSQGRTTLPVWALTPLRRCKNHLQLDLQSNYAAFFPPFLWKLCMLFIVTELNSRFLRSAPSFACLPGSVNFISFCYIQQRCPSLSKSQHVPTPLPLQCCDASPAFFYSAASWEKTEGGLITAAWH